MKILFRALVCHSILAQLALTALPLVFHPRPFAFAYPLALAPNIDYYDGYVDTTQSQSDSALIKRVPGDIVEARQAEVLVPIGPIIILTVVEVMLTIDYISEDNPVRGNDAEFLVA